MDYEGSRWRTEFWRGREYEDRVERIALAALLPPTGTRLVEIGAGFGRLADLYHGYAQVILLDYARSMLQDARARWSHDPRFIFVAADLYNLPFADSAFDTALTVRVLHHVADLPRAFAEIARIVRPHGAYVSDFANKRHLKAILRYYWGRKNGVNPFTLEPYEFVALNFDYHPDYIRQNLAGVGLVIRAMRAVSTFRLPALKRFVPTALLVSLDALLQSPLANLYLSPSIFLRAESTKAGAPTLNPILWRCITCADQLKEQPNELLCETCGAHYACVDGIWEFRFPIFR